MVIVFFATLTGGVVGFIMGIIMGKIAFGKSKHAPFTGYDKKKEISEMGSVGLGPNDSVAFGVEG